MHNGLGVLEIEDAYYTLKVVSVEGKEKELEQLLVSFELVSRVKGSEPTLHQKFPT